MYTISIDLKILDDRWMEWGLPKPETSHSGGVDLRAAVEDTVMLYPGETKLISTGLSMHINMPGVVAMLLPRSGLGHKSGIVLGNLTGLIDSDYQGPLMVSLWNRNREGKAFEINPGDRIAQMVIVNTLSPRWNLVNDHIPSMRGEGGFGSTGKS